MAKTVNASIVITRDGNSVSTPLKDMPYAKFVALESALAAGLAQLASWGSIRVAAAMDPTTKPTAMAMGGESDVRFELRADHGAGGSEFVVAYSGLAPAMADQVVAVMKAAANSVLVP